MTDHVLTCTIGGVPVSLYKTVSLDEQISQRSTLNFGVIDTTNSLSIMQNMAVNFKEDGVDKFNGFVDSADRVATVGTQQTYSIWAIKCKDNTYLADKDVYTGNEFSNVTTGDATILIHQNVLAKQGVVANYALDIDNDETSWSTGVHINTQETIYGLQLASAGTTFSRKETTDADWLAGTNDGLVFPYGNSLVLNGTPAIKMTGIAHGIENMNMQAYYRFYTFNGRVIAPNDMLTYGIWVSGNSPVISGGIDLTFTDGDTLRNTTDGAGNYAIDSRQIRAHPKTDIGIIARDKWCWRMIMMPSWCYGKTIAYASIALEGDKTGKYTIYVREVQYKDTNTTVLDNCFSTGVTPVFKKLTTLGYTDLDLEVVKVYEEQGVRVSPAYTNTNCDILRQSLVSWTATETQQDTSVMGYLPQITIEASIDDGATWITCINKQSIPNLYPGMHILNKNIRLRQTLRIGGPNPEMAPVLHDCSIVLTPSYVSGSVTDVSDADKAGDASMGTGTLTRLTSGSATEGLYLTGGYRDWLDGNLSDHTLYHTNNAWMYIYGDALHMPLAGVGEAKTCFDFAGQYQNFTAEIDVQLNVGYGMYGLFYRTTYLGNATNTFGYFAGITPTGVILGHGSNSSSGSWTQIASVDIPLTVGNWYHLTLVVSGTSHKVLLEGVQFINVTNSWYNGTGSVGARFYNDRSGYLYNSYFRDFGITQGTTQNGTRVHASQSVSSVGIVGNSLIQWNADVPVGCTYTVEASLDAGSTYAVCTNGGNVPGCEPGEDVTGKSLLIRETLATESSVFTPRIFGISWGISSAYSVTGIRTSPIQDIANFGYVGDSSFSWDADVPTHTSIIGKSSTDGTTFSTMNSGDKLVNLVSTPDLAGDDYTSNTIADYTFTYQAGGAIPTMNYDTSNSLVTIVGGTTGHALWTKSYLYEGTLWGIVSQSDAAGFTLRASSMTEFYRIVLYDDQAASQKQKAVIARMHGGVLTTLQTVSIDFRRDTYHLLKVTLIDGSITVFWDNTQIYTYYDPTPPNAMGNCGLYATTGGFMRCYSMSVQVLGTRITSSRVATQLVLTSTDPLVTPTVKVAIMSVRDRNIMTGKSISSSNYRYKKGSDCLKDIAASSRMVWDINKDKKLAMYNRAAENAPWILWSGIKSDGTCDIQKSTPPKLTGMSPAYRNRQYVTNAYELVTVVEQKLGNSYASSWALKYPVQRVLSLDVNGKTQDIILGATSGEDYYITSDNILAQDANADLLTDEQILTISYIGKKPYIAMKENSASQALLASLDGNVSGYSIISMVEDGGDCDKETADNLAQYRLDTNCILGRDWAFTTVRPGLEVGQLLTSFVPEYKLQDADMLIMGKVTTYTMHGSLAGAIYDITCTEGPPLGTWVRLFS